MIQKNFCPTENLTRNRLYMQFKFDPNQDYQIEAIAAVADLFTGQRRLAAGLTFDEHGASIAWISPPTNSWPIYTPSSAAPCAGPVRMAVWTWQATCGNGRVVCGRSTPTTLGMGVKLQMVAEVVCCVVGRSTTTVTTCVAPPVAATTRSPGSSSGGFGCCPPASDSLDSDSALVSEFCSAALPSWGVRGAQRPLLMRAA